MEDALVVHQQAVMNASGTKASSSGEACKLNTRSTVENCRNVLTFPSSRGLASTVGWRMSKKRRSRDSPEPGKEANRIAQAVAIMVVSLKIQMAATGGREVATKSCVPAAWQI
eukprot:TRINITY_DN8699_c0_g1_i3.p2 TRINITY_DN8699_c0_g1~~TRINITY_DN8699_c0_g1_i3.p2  ORF type:complete len:113 (-),score=20.62 TRINITY_DN8699_c0_g1_i3:823-1161(-)